MAPVAKRRKLSEDGVPTEVVATTDANTEQDKRRSLFVRNLPATVTKETLIEHFSQSYPLKHATIVLDSQTKQSRGFGFVTFTDAEDAQAALAEFNNSVLAGRKIKVEQAEARNRDVTEGIAGKSSSKNIKGEELRAKRKVAQQNNQPPKLIVRNLPWSIKSSDDLTKLFLSYGKVKQAIVPNLVGNKKMQAGYGIVIIRGKENAERALAGVNGKVVDGRTLAVDWAVDKDTWQKVKKQELEPLSEEQSVPAQPGSEEAGVDVNDSETDELDGSDGEEGVELDSATSVENDPNADEKDDLLDGDDDDDADGAGEDLDSSDIDSLLEEDKIPSKRPSSDFNTENTTVFLRNLPYDTTDEVLNEHFAENFGPVRYARVVYDHETDRPRGTGFVCFRSETDAKDCVVNAPKQTPSVGNGQSILQDTSADPSGKYTLSGRLLSVTRALPKPEADRRASESATSRLAKQQADKRRLYLLGEGTIPAGSKLYNTLSKTELDMRSSSAKQRQKLVKTNPNLGLSLTRLSVRNLPRFVDGKVLKQLAREAVVGFASDVKSGLRAPVSKEELARDGEVGREAEKQRKLQGKGLVRQAKIVYESESTGSKVAEGKGGRSRGYGFIEYWGHRSALMGLRWLNGHLVKKPQAAKGARDDDDGERGKRLIVEFAIENAQVVQRRNDRERRVKDRRAHEDDGEEKTNRFSKDRKDLKRKRGDDKESKGDNKRAGKPQEKKKKVEKSAESEAEQGEKNKIAMRNRIIAQKRMKRKGRRG